MQKDVVVDVDVADSIEKIFVKDFKDTQCIGVLYEQESFFALCCVSCHLVNDSHKNYVTDNEDNHWVKVSVTERVGEKDESNEP